jgi:hypothetical protein
MRTIDIREKQPELEPIGRIVFNSNEADERQFIDYDYDTKTFDIVDEFDGFLLTVNRDELVSLANAIDVALDLQGEFGSIV